MLPFERSEYEARIARVKASMDVHGIDVLVAADPANMNYLTGYDGWSFYTPQAVVVAGSLDEPICIVRGIDANGARATTFLADENIIGYPDHYVQNPDCHPMDCVAEEITRRGLGNATIGVEMDAYYYSAAAHAALIQGLPNASFKNANVLVNWVRIVKSPREIDYMRQAARIMDRVMQTAIDTIAPGVRQCDAVAGIYHAQVAGIDDYGGGYTALCPMLPTGKGTSTPHLTWSDDVFEVGQPTILELAATRFHYHCPQARTLFLGQPPQRLVDVSKYVVDGLDAALGAVRPGVTCEEVEAAWREAIAGSGLVKDSRIGYSCGLNYPPDWGEHTASLRPGDRTVMEPDMTFHCIPGIWGDDWGIEISECFRVTDDGAEPLCTTPRQLFIKL